MLLTAILMLLSPAGHAQPGTADAFEQNRKLGHDLVLYDIGHDAWIEPIRHALIPAAGPKTPLPSSNTPTTKPGESE